MVTIQKIITTVMAAMMVATMTACSKPIEEKSAECTDQVTLRVGVMGSIDAIPMVIANEKYAALQAGELDGVLADYIATVGYPEDTRGNIVLPEFKKNYLLSEERVQAVFDWSKSNGIITKDLIAKDIINDIAVKQFLEDKL